MYMISVARIVLKKFLALKFSEYLTFTETVRDEYIENTRLVLNIAQVYPARLRKSKITRLAGLACFFISSLWKFLSSCIK